MTVIADGHLVDLTVDLDLLPDSERSGYVLLATFGWVQVSTLSFENQSRLFSRFHGKARVRS